MTTTLVSVPDVAGLHLRVVPAEARAEAAAIWGFAAAAAWGATGFASWTWTNTWLEHYGDVVDHRFVIAVADGLPCGIALVTAGARRPWHPRTAHLGTAGEPRGSGVFVERNHVVADPAQRRQFVALLAAELGRDARWDRLHLDGLDPRDAQELASRWPQATLNTEDCPVTDLDQGADVLDALTASRRRRARTTLRAFGPLDVEWADDAAQARDILDELIDLHQSHWTARDEPGAFSDARFTAFHRAFVQRAVPAGQAALVRVRRGEETVGCLYGLIDGGRLLFYQGGLRTYEDNRLRSGLAAHVSFMRASAAHGLTQYDFLAPASRYKLELATRTDALAWVTVERPGRWRTRASAITRRTRAAR